jgi:hypothetical protein
MLWIAPHACDTGATDDKKRGGGDACSLLLCASSNAKARLHNGEPLPSQQDMKSSESASDKLS